MVLSQSMRQAYAKTSDMSLCAVLSLHSIGVHPRRTKTLLSHPDGIMQTTSHQPIQQVSNETYVSSADQVAFT